MLQAANAAFARDVSAGLASASSIDAGSSKTNSSAASSSKKPEKPASPFSNYSTAQSLGYTDPDAERLAIEDQRRRTQGVVGDWETVAPPPPPLPGEVDEEADSKDAVADEISSKKRQVDESAGSTDDVRRFKVRKRTLAPGLEDLWDPGDIPIKLKSDKADGSVQKGTETAPPHAAENSTDQTTDQNASNPSKSADIESTKPKWTPKGWKRATTATEDESETNNSNDQTIRDTTQQEVQIAIVETVPDSSEIEPDPSIALQSQDLAQSTSIKSGSSSTETADIKQEANVKEPSFTLPLGSSGDTPTGGMFRKRKIPAGNRGRR